jgi:hypothetical protein
MNEENRQKLSQLAERAWTNETLRNELLSDPTPVLQKDGIEIPKGFDVQVRSDKDSVSFNFVPQTTPNGELPDSALENVTGGLTFIFKLIAVKTVSWSSE